MGVDHSPSLHPHPPLRPSLQAEQIDNWGHAVVFTNTLTHRQWSLVTAWIADMCRCFKLRRETLCLAVHLIRRCLQIETPANSRIQLLAVSALLIASKVEEIYGIDVDIAHQSCEDAYTLEQVLSQERHLLGLLDYAVLRPTLFHYTSVLLYECGIVPAVTADLAAAVHALSIVVSVFQKGQTEPDMALGVVLVACQLVPDTRVDTAKLATLLPAMSHHIELFKDCLAHMMEGSEAARTDVLRCAKHEYPSLFSRIEAEYGISMPVKNDAAAQ